jgi:hypothetical protein
LFIVRAAAKPPDGQVRPSTGKGRFEMKRALLIAAVVLAVLTASFWAAKGAHVGWTQNKQQVKTIDPITEIEQIEWQEKFLPGLDFLGIGLGLAGALLVGSFFCRNQTKQQNPQNS